MNGRQLARWALRATIIGAFLGGVVYTATAASAGAIWNITPPTTVVEQPVDPEPLPG